MPPIIQHEPGRVEDDLRGLISGDVRCDELAARLYASDGSVFEVRPLGVVRPRHREDVLALVQYAAEQHISLHARGAGTTLRGGSLGPGLVVDFSKYMNHLRELESGRWEIQPGATLAAVSQQLTAAGQFFPIAPPEASVRTLGGVVATDAVSSRWLRYGATHDYVESIEAVLPDGTLEVFGPQPLNLHAMQHTVNGSGEYRQALARLAVKFAPRLKAVAGDGHPLAFPQRFADAVGDDHVDLTRLMCGSEGSLALFTRITLRSLPLPPPSACGLFYFESLAKAADAAGELRAMDPVACDLMDRRLLSVAREDDVRFELVVPAFAEAVLLVEFDERGGVAASSRLAAAAERLQTNRTLTPASSFAQDPAEAELFWGLSDNYASRLTRIRGRERPIRLMGDMVIPPDQLGGYLADVQAAMRQLQVTCSLFAHTTQALVRVVPFLDLPQDAERHKLRAILAALLSAARHRGGWPRSEPSQGIAEDPAADLAGEVARSVKSCFDPNSLLNPSWSLESTAAVFPGKESQSAGPGLDASAGSLFPSSSSAGALSLRPYDRLSEVLVSPANEDAPAGDSVASPRDAATANGVGNRPLVTLQLDWREPTLASATRDCNGCGVCRATDTLVRMCPLFRVTHAEEASPRAKANLMRAVAEGTFDPAILKTELAREVIDLCVHCHMCRLECPGEVDIPRLMLEARATHVAANGMRFSDWFFTHIDAVSRFFSRFHRPANWALSNPPARWVLEKMAGVARGRKLPPLAPQPFWQLAYRRGLTRRRRRGARVALLVDTYANYYDPQLAEAVVSVLEHNGVSVFVPPAQQHSAMPMIAAGALEAARRVARRNIDIFAEAVRQGYTVVTTEPSAALALSHEYPILFPGDEDARMVSLATREACHFLWKLHQQGSLRLDFKRIDTAIAYHAPCHLKALDIGLPGENLMRLIPGLQVHEIERGCSGMAGVWGLRRENHRQSLRAGRNLINAVRNGAIPSATECSTCKLQMQQSSQRRTVHPIKILAEAYGVLPRTEPTLPRHLSTEALP